MRDVNLMRCVVRLLRNPMEEQRIRAFLRHDYGRVVAAVALVIEDRGRAEDAVQEALVRYWERAAEVDSPRAWITTVALNQARTSRRRGHAESRALERLTRRRSSSEIVEDDVDEQVRVAVEHLPAGQRSAVALHYLLDLSVVEVADVMGVAEGTVKAHLHRARIALRSALRQEETDDARR